MVALLPRIIFFILGICVGSFVNVVVSRYRKEKKWWRGRSVCDHCQRQLKWWENVPIFSYLILRGQCFSCHSPIPFEYTFVELINGLLFVLTFLNSPTVLAALLNCSIVTLLVIIFLFDLNYQIIPDRTVVGLVILSFFSYLLNSNYQLIIPTLTGLGTSAFFFLLHLITKGRGMGLGDVKYAFFMGLFLSWPKIIVGLYLAFLTGALVGVILILMGNKKFGQHVAFGPFLVLGTFVSWFWGEKIISLVSGLLL